MNKLNHLEKLAKAISASDKPDEERNADLDLAKICVDSYVDYHNMAVKQGALITIARFRLGEEEFIDYCENQHEHRKAMHRDMIDKTIVLNDLCGRYDVGPIYDGPLDKTKGRDDQDTRFGVAKLAEEVCHDLFRASDLIDVPEKARNAYNKYISEIASQKKPDSIRDMLRKAVAMTEMDATDRHEEYGK